MKSRVLIIDSEPEVRRTLTAGLTEHDYRATACPDGISAIHELSRSRQKGEAYNYLVIGIFLPDIDGLTFLKVIKCCYPELPVIVITAFGEERFKLAAISQTNTGYLEKPFETDKLVAALEKLTAGATTLDSFSAGIGHDKPVPQQSRESIGAYFFIRIIDSSRSIAIFNEIYRTEGVRSCEAVRGDIDLIVLAQASLNETSEAFLKRISSVAGIEVTSIARVEKPQLDRDVGEFLDLYHQCVKKGDPAQQSGPVGTSSYIIVDFDKKSVQKIYTTVFSIEEVIFCDVVEGNTRLICKIATPGAVGKTPLVIKKLKELDGVLRVREEKIIQVATGSVKAQKD
jgi:CheY-like chemotaxis protein